ncbi:MAG: hypothetical protein ACFFFB_07270 [Candidatus Heimdallarchaeota archaeon]
MASELLYTDLQNEVEETSKDCNFYKQICENQEYDFDQTIKDSNLDEVPYINWNYFKESLGKFPELLRIPYDKLSYWTISSSTTGDPSLVGRGPEDIDLFKRNYRRVFEEYANMESITQLILFAPSLAFMNKMPGSWYGKRGFLFYRDITDIWKGYKIEYLLKFKIVKALLYMISHFKKKAFIEIDGKLMQKSLKEVERKSIPTLIANSAPLMYQNFKDYYKSHKEGFSMPESFRLQLGGGGWDGVKGRVKLGYKINKAEFMEFISEFFNIPYDNISDNYGATEIPIACGGHWSKKYEDFIFHLEKNQGQVIIRELNSLERIKKVNEPGILEVLTPYGVESYAGVAVMLDDIIEVIDFNRCNECGREGIVFRITGRLTPEIGKGCSSFTNLYPFK